MSLSFVMFFSSLMMILLYSCHFIQLLLLVEAMLLSIFLVICWSFLMNVGIMGLFIFLLVMVCMGGFSISLLVSLARFFGRDFWYLRFIF